MAQPDQNAICYQASDPQYHAQCVQVAAQYICFADRYGLYCNGQNAVGGILGPYKAIDIKAQMLYSLHNSVILFET